LGLALLVVGVGPSSMRPVVSLPDFGGLGAKMITPGFSPLHVYTESIACSMDVSDARLVPDPAYVVSSSNVHVLNA
jgi:hypothetical protein